MEYLTNAFNRLTNFFRSDTNLELVGTYHFHPRSQPPAPGRILAHQSVLKNAFSKHLYPHEMNTILNELRRSTMTDEDIYDDFFANDVEKHEIPFDEHVENGLAAMADAFRPPRRSLPCHICDVENHYPYKWQVNAEPPFSTDDYFLENRKLFSDFYDPASKTWKHYVDPEDMLRRHGSQPSPSTLEQVTPAKFGFMRQAIFAWTRRWHHVIKDGFKDLSGLTASTYVKSRFIFPMLLHSKTAIVKISDPNKMRTIWGCSKPWVIADTMFYWEYIAWIKLNPGSTPMLWGYETFTGGWMRLNAELFSRHMQCSFLTLDWKRFDKRAYFSLISKIMLVIRGYIDFNRGYVPTISYPDTAKNWSDTKAARLERLWLWTLENIFTAPIVLPDGRMYKRRYAGIPSGLYITQLLDSWYNYTMLATILSSLGFDPRLCIIKVQGDDSIVRLYVLIPPDVHDAFLLKMQELADHYFKSVISLEKSEVRSKLNGCEVLSYRNNNGLPSRDEISMLAQFYHTKAKAPTPEITMAQAIGFAYASCGNHQRAYDALKDVYDHYQEQGFTPNRAGLTLVFGDSPDLPLLDFPLDHFPTVSETKRFLLHTEYRNTYNENRTWPRSYFLHGPCDTP
jgi:hypothetical protein